MVVHKRVEFRTQGDGDLIDLSRAVSDAVTDSGCRDGACVVFVGGSTAAVTTIEYEPGLKVDFPRFLERVAPREMDYEHNRTWGDGNGFGHVRAALLGPSVTVPVVDGRAILGQWQQPVLVECDNRPRTRIVTITVIGE